MTPTNRKGDDTIRSIDRLKGEIFDKINNAEINDIVTNGVTMRIGNKIYTLKQITGVENVPQELEIRAEYESKFMARLSEMGKFINEKMLGIHSLVSALKSEMEARENELKRMSENLPTPMPDIPLPIDRGLSVIKDPDTPKGLIWIIPAWYSPKRLDNRLIKESYLPKLTKPMRIFINVKDNKVLSVSTRRMNSSDFFPHYHQVRPDCWGSWKWSSETFDGPVDAIRIADIVVGILDKINTVSIGNARPEDLPSISTLRKKLAPIIPPSDPYQEHQDNGRGPGLSIRPLRNRNIMPTPIDDTWDTADR